MIGKNIDAMPRLYYVSSRYYDPEVGRFISPDAVAILAATPMGLTDKNLYAYCDNNPVCRVDYGGNLWDTIGAGGTLVGGTAGISFNRGSAFYQLLCCY